MIAGDAAFDRCISNVLNHEGGLVDNPADPGGVTKYGISLRAFPALGRDGIVRLTEADAISIYHVRYWQRMRCDELSAGVALCVLDAGVMSGPVRAIKWLQQAVGVDQDGGFGDDTLRAVQRNVGLAARIGLCHSICAQRRAFVSALPTFPTFGRGWIARIEDTLTRAIGMETA